MTTILGLVIFATWLFALIEACTVPSENYRNAGKSKAMWVVLIVLFGIFAAVPYFLIARPAIK